MTKIELRLLYLLNKHGGQARNSTLQQATARVTADERKAALRSLEDLGLVSSGPAPSKTRPAMAFWLTQAGKDYVQDAVARGELGSPE